MCVLFCLESDSFSVLWCFSNIGITIQKSVSAIQLDCTVSVKKVEYCTLKAQS